MRLLMSYGALDQLLELFVRKTVAEVARPLHLLLNVLTLVFLNEINEPSQDVRQVEDKVVVI